MRNLPLQEQDSSYLNETVLPSSEHGDSVEDHPDPGLGQVDQMVLRS